MPLVHHVFSGVTQLGTPWAFGFWSLGSDPLSAVQTDAVTFFTGLWNDALTALCVAAVGGRTVTSREVTQSSGLQVTRIDNSVTLNGTAVGNSLPTDSSIVVTLRSEEQNRRGRGRAYMPPFAASTLTLAGRLSTAAATDLADAWKGNMDIFTSGAPGPNPVVYSRMDRLTREIRSMDVGDLFDTQRGRQDRIPETRTVRQFA